MNAWRRRAIVTVFSLPQDKKRRSPLRGERSGAPTVFLRRGRGRRRRTGPGRLSHPGQHVVAASLQRGAADAVAPHDGLNDRMLNHLAARRLDAVPTPRLLLL